MAHKKGPAAGDGRGQGYFSRWRTNSHLNNQVATPRQESIRTELTDADRCTGAGIAVRAAAPVLAWCRQALAAGLDPETSVRCHRGETVCLTVRSIAEAAALEINPRGTGFVPRAVRTASPVRSSGPIGVESSLIASSLSGAAPP